MKYELVYKETDLYGEETGKVISFHFRADTLEDMLSNYEDFLKGCGFQLEGRQLDLIDIEEFNLNLEEHSNYYYDYDRNMPVEGAAGQPAINIDLSDYEIKLDPNNFNYSTMDTRNV
jgi:hypothetical protein